ncbi:MAG: glycosyltransferase family 39 protein [Acidobacteriota bacterium]
MLAAPRARRDVLILVALTIALGLTYFLYSNGDHFYPDSVTYLAPAASLLRGLGFVDGGGAIETLRTPGYPVFLVPFVALTPSAVPIVLFQHLLNGALAAGIYALTRRRLGRFAAIVAAVIFACDMPTIHHANKVLSETLFTAVLFALFALLLRVVDSPRWNTIVIAALLSGILTLIRPVAILWFVVAGIFLVSKVPHRMLAAFLLVAAAFPLGWAVRNQYRTGVFTVSSVAGSNMLMYRAAGALALLEDGDFARNLARIQIELRRQADGDIEDAMHIPDAGELPHALLAREYGKIGRGIVLQHPVASALLTFRGLGVVLFGSDWEAAMIVSRLNPAAIHVVFGAWPMLLFLLSVTGLRAMWGCDRTLALLVAATCGYFALIAAGGESEARFRVPFTPEYALAAGAGLELVMKKLRRDSRPRSLASPSPPFPSNHVSGRA